MTSMVHLSLLNPENNMHKADTRIKRKRNVNNLLNEHDMLLSIKSNLIPNISIANIANNTNITTTTNNYNNLSQVEQIAVTSILVYLYYYIYNLIGRISYSRFV